MTRRVVRGLLVALLVLLPTASSASAPALTVTVDGGGPLRYDLLAPGVPRTQHLTLTSTAPEPVAVRVGVTDLASGEGGCVGPEVRAGDTTCAPDEGELLPWLRLRVERLDGGDRLVAQGSFVELADRDLDLGTIADGVSVRLRMTVWPALEAGNDTMTDTVTFGFRWRAGDASAVLPATGAAGGDAASGGGVAGTTGLLPATGGEVPVSALLLGVGLVVLGVALARRRPETDESEGLAGSVPA
jgi:LPXTG-motif cell wall-anchored protein